MPRATIARITAVKIVNYRDNGEIRAYVSWVDTKGKTGTTEGLANNAHMKALVARATRDGVNIVRENAGWTPGMDERAAGHLESAYKFFLSQGGGVVGREEETARALARAEKYADDHGWSALWEEDPEPYETDDPGDRPFEVLMCTLRDEDGDVLASLGGIGMSGKSGDDSRYQRLVEAELALEAMPEQTPNRRHVRRRVRHR